MYGTGTICVSENLNSTNFDDRWVASVTDTTDLDNNVVSAYGPTRRMALAALLPQIETRLSWWPNRDKTDVKQNQSDAEKAINIP